MIAAFSAMKAREDEQGGGSYDNTLAVIGASPSAEQNLEFLRYAERTAPLFAEWSRIAYVSGRDLGRLLTRACLAGPLVTYAPGHFCEADDGDGDLDVDLADFALFQEAYTGPL